MAGVGAARNAEQVAAWDGEEGAYWAANHEIFEAVLDRYQPAFDRAAAIEPHHHVLDVGCGTGAGARAAAAAASRGRVLGVDLSTRMIEVARRLATQPNIAFERADAQIHPFGECYDVLISQTGAMFFDDPDAAFANLRRGLRPGGRMALLTWQRPEHQEWLREFSLALTGLEPPEPAAGVPGPFSLSDPDHVTALLDHAGFSDIRITGLRESTTYGRTVEQAHRFLAGFFGRMLDGQEPDRRAAALDALRATITAHRTEDGIRFDSATWLITAARP
ncbi:class I SAM-dependent methyltransferase [Nocardia asteroides]|uniref:class I SAM-dependent methyltransferase n=1 Tax=Nocardia asteroides TaxID=1824 RepID=UPI001E436DD4|nr:class I SAM-dependent methyltransferase [Nocardia asteroides]UGT62267.1 class I SAM-dependent methyltransferase [Nocardia asteroides]